eukprot:356723-Chlamydomonas_euryale.AAC.1
MLEAPTHLPVAAPQAASAAPRRPRAHLVWTPRLTPPYSRSPSAVRAAGPRSGRRTLSAVPIHKAVERRAASASAPAVSVRTAIASVRLPTACCRRCRCRYGRCAARATRRTTPRLKCDCRKGSRVAFCRLAYHRLNAMVADVAADAWRHQARYESPRRRGRCLRSAAVKMMVPWRHVARGVARLYNWRSRRWRARACVDAC